ncbi:MAG: DUF1761 domain-containing protein [Bacteroidota bacterium]
MDLFSGINYLAVLVAAVAAFGLGALWYSPILFGKTWQKSLGFTDEYLQGGNMAAIFGSSFVMMLFMAFGIGIFMKGHESSDWLEGAHLGLLVGFLWVGPSMAINVLYQRKSFTLWAIDAGYQILFMIMMGAIIGAWR